MIKRGTFTKNGKPTRFAVELYLKYFELGGRPDDVEMNPLICNRIQQIMGWKDGEGIVSLMFGIHPSAQNSKTHEYYVPMVKAKELAWDIYSNCV